MERRFGKWIKGDYNRMSFNRLSIAFKKASKNVKKPTAVQSDMRNGKMIRWRIYHKPIQEGELD